MLKDIVIAALAAHAMLRIPWFAACSGSEQIVIWLALAVCLLFFCLFCEEMAEKWRKYKERVQSIRDLVVRLRKEESPDE